MVTHDSEYRGRSVCESYVRPPQGKGFGIGTVLVCCLSLAQSNRIHPFGLTRFAFSSIGIQADLSCFTYPGGRGDARQFQAGALPSLITSYADPGIYKRQRILI
jgi:hypothetical protein